MTLNVNLKGGCLILAALLCIRADSGFADEQFLRPDVVACLEAVDHLELPFDYLMTLKCIEISEVQCGSDVTGPKSACIKDIVDDVVELVTVRRASLPENIGGDSFKAKRYKRALERIDVALAGHLERSETQLDRHDLCLDRPASCELVAITFAWMEIPRAARFAGIKIP